MSLRIALFMGQMRDSFEFHGASQDAACDPAGPFEEPVTLPVVHKRPRTDSEASQPHNFDSTTDWPVLRSFSGPCIVAESPVFDQLPTEVSTIIEEPLSAACDPADADKHPQASSSSAAGDSAGLNNSVDQAIPDQIIAAVIATSTKEVISSSKPPSFRQRFRQELDEETILSRFAATLFKYCYCAGFANETVWRGLSNSRIFMPTPKSFESIPHAFGRLYRSRRTASTSPQTHGTTRRFY